MSAVRDISWELRWNVICAVNCLTIMENLSFSYYDQHNTGQMMSRLVSDLFDISEAAHHALRIYLSLL